MNYSNVLEILYGNSTENIVNLLNMSRYILKYNQGEELLFLHTGFIFETHKNTEMQVLYDVQNGFCVIHPIAYHQNIPIINSIIFLKEKNEPFIKKYYHLILKNVHEDKVDLENFYEVKDIPNHISEKFEEIIILDKEKNIERKIKTIQIFYDNGKILDLPLQKKLSDKLFYNGTTYKKYVSNEEYYNNEDYNWCDIDY